MNVGREFEIRKTSEGEKGTRIICVIVCPCKRKNEKERKEERERENLEKRKKRREGRNG